MKVAVLDLLCDGRIRGPFGGLYGLYFRKQFVSIMPQIVSVWCRQLGHDVTYATYYGQNFPERLVPDDTDVIFISSYTQASALAYALAELFRRRGTLTIIGGPHARSFPTDCQRAFDIVVRNCDRNLVADILNGRIDPPAIVDSGHQLSDFPSVEERASEIEIATFQRGRRLVTSIVPVLSSVGCPYSCHFCVDWNSRYVPLAPERLKADLEFIAKRWPGLPVIYHDPNFAVRFDETMSVIESLPEPLRPEYMMESSLSILKPERLPRLRATRCIYVAPGIESWTAYSNKSGATGTDGRTKLNRVVGHLRQVLEYVPGVQANFIFGGDEDFGDEPVDISLEFIEEFPEVWPTINIPTPFGGTPLYDAWYRSDRILTRMPFSFYYNPWLAITVANYSPLEFYTQLIRLHSALSRWQMLTRRLTTRVRPVIRFVDALRTADAWREISVMRSIRNHLENDTEFRAFHEGRRVPLPRFYREVYRRRLGRYSELVREPLISPILEPPHSIDGGASASPDRTASVAPTEPATGASRTASPDGDQPS
jgi:hypothetical protein